MSCFRLPSGPTEHPSPRRRIPRACRGLCFAALLTFALPSALSAQPFGFGAMDNFNTNSDTDSGDDLGVHTFVDGTGRWYAVWETRDDFGGTIGTDDDIAFSTSSDDGATWSAPVIVNSFAAIDGSFSDFHPQIASDGAGTLIVSWYSSYNGGGMGADFDILCATSTDNGGTWSAASPINTNATTDVGNDRGQGLVHLGGDDWIAYWTSDEDVGGSIGSDVDVLTALSFDNGATWSAPTALNSNATTDAGAEGSPRIGRNSSGDLICVWYSLDTLGGTIGGDRDILYAMSSDDGATWSAVAALNTNAATDTGEDYVPEIANDGGNRWIVVWYSTDSLGATIGTDFDLLFTTSNDNGSNWSAPAALNSNAATDTGPDQQASIAYSGGDWIVVWRSAENLGGSIGTDTDILLSLSNDIGATWSAPVALNSTAATDSGSDDRPSLTTNGSGVWHVAWESTENFGGTAGTDFDLFHTRSTTVPVELSAFSLD